MNDTITQTGDDAVTAPPAPGIKVIDLESLRDASLAVHHAVRPLYELYPPTEEMLAVLAHSLVSEALMLLCVFCGIKLGDGDAAKLDEIAKAIVPDAIERLAEIGTVADAD